MFIDNAVYATVSYGLFTGFVGLAIFIYVKHDKKTDANSEKLGDISVNLAKVVEGNKHIDEALERHEELHVELKADIKELKKNIHQHDLRIGKIENKN